MILSPVFKCDQFPNCECWCKVSSVEWACAWETAPCAQESSLRQTQSLRNALSGSKSHRGPSLRAKYLPRQAFWADAGGPFMSILGPGIVCGDDISWYLMVREWWWWSSYQFIRAECLNPHMCQHPALDQHTCHLKPPDLSINLLNSFQLINRIYESFLLIQTVFPVSGHYRHCTIILQ